MMVRGGAPPERVPQCTEPPRACAVDVRACTSGKRVLTACSSTRRSSTSSPALSAYSIPSCARQGTDGRTRAVGRLQRAHGASASVGGPASSVMGKQLWRVPAAKSHRPAVANRPARRERAERHARSALGPGQRVLRRRRACSERPWMRRRNIGKPVQLANAATAWCPTVWNMWLSSSSTPSSRGYRLASATTWPGRRAIAHTRVRECVRGTNVRAATTLAETTHGAAPPSRKRASAHARARASCPCFCASRMAITLSFPPETSATTFISATAEVRAAVAGGCGLGERTCRRGEGFGRRKRCGATASATASPPQQRHGSELTSVHRCHGAHTPQEEAHAA